MAIIMQCVKRRLADIGYKNTHTKLPLSSFMEFGTFSGFTALIPLHFSSLSTTVHRFVPKRLTRMHYRIFNFKIFLELYPGLWLWLRTLALPQTCGKKTCGRDENEKGKNGKNRLEEN